MEVQRKHRSLAYQRKLFQWQNLMTVELEYLTILVFPIAILKF